MSCHFVTESTSALVIHFQLDRQLKHIFSQLKQTLRTDIYSFFAALFFLVIILLLSTVFYFFISVTQQIIYNSLISVSD